MRSKRTRIAPTMRGAGIKPACPHCGNNDHVIRVWFGGQKNWACSVHYRITSTKTRQPTVKERLLHKMPEPETFGIAEVFPNRRARRAR